MTTEDYELLARTLNKAYPQARMGKSHDVEIETWDEIVRALMRALKRNDPEFSTTTFKKQVMA